MSTSKKVVVVVVGGIFQGDTLSPLLFCITLTPLSLLLDHLDGYNTKVAGQLNHLLYVYDLKLYTGSNTHLEALLHTVHMFSADVGLTFGLDKCAKLSVVRASCGLLVMLFFLVG